MKRKPSCTDCHKGHALSDPRSAEFRNQESNQCGNCHTELNRAYGMSMHGALSNLGYTEGAKCSDCHGAHDILPLSDPNSLMSPQNRIHTCSKCHQDMSPRMASFDPHADQYDENRSAVVYWVYHGVLTFIIVVFGFFGLHAVVWFFRGLFDVLKHGRPKPLEPGTPGYVRFKPFHRVAHTVMVVSFLGLALTGLPLKFSDYRWAQWLAAALGGFASTGLWHRVFAISMFGCFLAYVVLLTRHYFVARQQGRSRKDTLFGPDSPLPNLRDARDFAAMVRWFLGRGPKPTFERWAYWEKFDFFGATSDTILIGLSGLILWFPELVLQLPARRSRQRRQSRALHPGPAGHRFRVRHPLLRHAFPSRQIPHGYVDPDGSGQRRGNAARTPRGAGASASRRTTGRDADQCPRTWQTLCGPHRRLRRPLYRPGRPGRHHLVAAAEVGHWSLVIGHWSLA